MGWFQYHLLIVSFLANRYHTEKFRLFVYTQLWALACQNKQNGDLKNRKRKAIGDYTVDRSGHNLRLYYELSSDGNRGEGWCHQCLEWARDEHQVSNASYSGRWLGDLINPLIATASNQKGTTHDGYPHQKSSMRCI